MEENEEFALIGGIKVPKEFKTRWDELISTNREYKAQLQELKSDLREAKAEAQENNTSKASTEELTKAQERIAELEATLQKTEFSSVLVADGIDAEDTDTVEYLEHKWSKSEKDGKKLSFKDFYESIKENNAVLKAARKPRDEGKSDNKTDTQDNQKTDTKVFDNKKTTSPPPKGRSPNSNTNTFSTPEEINRLDPKAFATNAETLRKQLFGS